MELQRSISCEKWDLLIEKGVRMAKFWVINDALALLYTIPHLILSEDDQGKFVTVNTAKFDIDSTFQESEYKIYYTDGLPDALADLLLFLLEEEFVDAGTINNALK